MQQVVILSLAEKRDGCGDSCDCGPASKAEEPVRVPVLSCADALKAEGLQVDLVTACSDADIDAAVKPVEAGDALLVVAAATDGELRAVVRRMVRHLAPPPSQRPTELPAGRTVFDLPPLAVLGLHPSVPDLVDRLDLPREPAEVAAAVMGGRVRRMDLLRNDGGSVTMHASLLGGLDAQGNVGIWHGRVEVDDAVLATGDEPLIACAIGNAGSTELDGLPLLTHATPDDALVEVAVAIPVVRKRLLRASSMEFEVRRAKGRAVSVTPRGDGDLHLVDDGVAGVLTRKRSWWVEPAVWAAYVM